MSSGIIDTLDALLCSTPTLIRAEMNEKIAEEKKRDEVIVESKDEILIKSI